MVRAKFIVNVPSFFRDGCSTSICQGEQEMLHFMSKYGASHVTQNMSAAVTENGYLFKLRRVE